MVVSLAFVNGFHHWPVIKRFPPCSTSTPLFSWLGFVPFGLLDWRPWADSSIIILLFPKLHKTLSHFIWNSLRHRSTLFFCGYDRLLSMDPPCSFVAMTPLDLIWHHFCILSDHDSFIDQFFSDIYLSFRYLGSSLSILDSLLSPYSVVSFIMCFGYLLPL